MTRVTTLLFTALLFIGCDSLQGPEGPAGAANIEVVERSYTAGDATLNQSTAEVNFDVSAISQEVYEDGAVEVEYDLDGQWLALPWTLADGNISLEMTYSYGPQELNLAFISNTDQIYRSQLPEGELKITVIPPSETDGESSTSSHKLGNLNVR